MKTFKVGDKVYCPINYKGRILTLVDGKDGNYQLELGEDDIYTTYTTKGKRFISDEVPSIFHATVENYELLSKLYPHVKFEQPPKPPTPKEIIQAYINKQGYCLCCCNGYYTPTEDEVEISSHRIIIGLNNNNQYIDTSSSYWKYAIPFNPLTLEEIKELP